MKDVSLRDQDGDMLRLSPPKPTDCYEDGRMIFVEVDQCGSRSHDPDPSAGVYLTRWQALRVAITLAWMAVRMPIQWGKAA